MERHSFASSIVCDGIRWLYEGIFLILPAMPFFYGVSSVVPQPPQNLSLLSLFPDAAVIAWDIDHSQVISGFHLSVQPAVFYGPGGGHRQSYVVKLLNGWHRVYKVQELHPGTLYRLHVVAYNDEGVSNASDTMTFKTLVAPVGERRARLSSVHPAEVLIVFFILVSWICAVALFLRKWGKIRITQPREMRYKHAPKNLETIKVVKRPTESVIYKSHSQSYTTTMAARQKKLERMSTMPNIKLNVSTISGQRGLQSRGSGVAGRRDSAGIQPTIRALSRTITAPVLEVDELVS